VKRPAVVLNEPQGRKVARWGLLPAGAWVKKKKGYSERGRDSRQRPLLSDNFREDVGKVEPGQGSQIQDKAPERKGF